MRSSLHAFAVLLAAAPLFAQQGQTTPQSTPPPPTLRTRVNLVVVDVVVTDKDLKPVHGLKASDFIMLENGASQTLKVFEEHAPTTVEGPPPPPLAPGTFTNYSQFRTDGPLNILLMDAINTDPIDQARVRQQLLRFLDESRPGTQFAFLALDMGGLKIIQGFTPDKDVLRAAVNNFKPMLTPFQESVGGGGGGRGAFADASSGGPSMGGRAGAGMNRTMRALKPQYTLDGVNMLARYMAGLPGHKNLLWFASHFDFDMIPGSVGGNPYVRTPAEAQEFRDTVDLFASRQVTIYPINAQGLTVRSQMEDNLNQTDLAVQTGGTAILNNNDISGIIKRDVEMGASYYTLAYTPTNPRYDGRYRTLKVVVRQPGVTLSYRHGYYADNPDRGAYAAANSEQSSPASTAGFSAMHMALTRGTPEPTQILLFARVLPATTNNESGVADGNHARPNLKGPFRRFAIDATFDPRNMAFQEQPDGKLHDTVEFISFLYSSDNKLVNMVSTTAVLDLTESPEAFAARGGIPVHQEISVPAKGDYFLRIGVHDQQGDRVGAVEVPISAVRKLAPAPPKSK